METFSVLLVLASLVGGAVFVLKLIIDLLKRRPKKKHLINLAICFVVLVVGSLLHDTTLSEEERVAIEERSIKDKEIRNLKIAKADAEYDKRAKEIEAKEEEDKIFKQEEKEKIAAEKEAKQQEDNLIKEREEERKVKSKVDYRIEKIEDIQIAGAERFALDVVVTGQPNSKDLKRIAKEITDKMKKEKPFNAIVIGFYDYPEYIGYGYILGKVEYAPEGDWGKANTVKKGKYKNMDYKYSLKEKDWNTQLTLKEIEIYKAWKDLYKVKQIGTDLVDEDVVTQGVADHYGLTFDTVNNILDKQIEWMFQE